MGQQTTVALVVFLACHVALVLDLVALSTREWVVTDIKTVNGSEATNVTYTKGLWQICKSEDHKDTKCEHLDESKQGRKYKAVQGLYVTGTGTIVVGLLLFYVFLLNTKMNTSVGLASVIEILEWLSTILILAALILHGLNYKDNDDIPSDKLDEKLGWSYWVAVAGGVVTFIASVVSFRLIKLMKSRQAGYEDI